MIDPQFRTQVALASSESSWRSGPRRTGSLIEASCFRPPRPSSGMELT